MYALSFGMDIDLDPRIESPMEFAQAFTGAFARLPDETRAKLSAQWAMSLSACYFFDADPGDMSAVARCNLRFNAKLVNRLPLEHVQTLVGATIAEFVAQGDTNAADELAEAWGFDVAALDDFVAQNMELLA